jgi:polyisoprenoid-binding protein YceI
MRTWLGAASCAALLVVSSASLAAPLWIIESPASRLGFVATWEGTPFDGVFQRFGGTILFDPADLPSSRFEVTVDLASADTASADRDEALAGSEWFFVARNPRATFLTTAFRDLGGGRFEAEGTLSLKGVSRPVSLPFAWSSQGEMATLKGESRLVRTDFNVGEGEWSAGDVIGLDVRVLVDLRLRRATGAGP